MTNLRFACSDLTIAILCGGKATRMGTVCSAVPKALLPFAGRPFLEWLVEWALHYSSDIVLCAGHMAGQVEKVFGTQRWRKSGVRVIREKVPLGTGNALKFVAEHVSRKDILLMNGDTIVTFPLREAANVHSSNKYPVTLIAAESSNQNPGEVVADEAEELVRFGLENQDINPHDIGIFRIGCNTGAYFFETEFVRELCLPNDFVSLERTVLPSLMRKRFVRCLFCADAVFDFGTPERYEAANMLLASHVWQIFTPR